MKITEDMEKKIVLAVQAALGILVILLSVKNSTKIQQSGKMKKVMDRDAKRIGRLHKKEYKLQKKLLKQRYKKKLNAGN